MWVQQVNQCEFLVAPPTLDLFFASDGCANVAMRLEIDESLDVVPFGETIAELLLVLECSSFQVIGNATIKHAIGAAEDVDVIDRHGGEFCHESWGWAIVLARSRREFSCSHGGVSMV